MKKFTSLAACLLCLAASFSASAQEVAAPAESERAPIAVTSQERKLFQSYPERARIWEPFMHNLELRERQPNSRSLATPARGAILFIGSSSIVKWDLDAAFPDLPVYNRGFGGSHIQDSTYYANRILIPYQPRTIVFYAGDNDVSADHTREQIVGDFQTFAWKIRQALPDTKLIFLAIKPSIARAKKEAFIVEVNHTIEKWMATKDNMVYVDIHTPMLTEKGELRPELYVEDGLHLSPTGYEIWTKILRSYLD